MPQSTANARTALTDRSKNPTATVAPAGVGSGGKMISLTLMYERQFVPEDLWDALITKYGAGKVISDTDEQGMGVYRWRVLV
jgi:hypothetical protein